MSLILTEAGRDLYAQSEVTGDKLQATHMAVGDGGGAPVAHTDKSEALVNETWRGELQAIKRTASGEVEFTGHVPITVGGWYIRELAVYAGDTLLALGSHPETWKPAPESPDKVELVITAPVKFANTDNISLTVDTTKVLASQEHVAEMVAEHNADQAAHADIRAVLALLAEDTPDAATIDRSGIVELATPTETVAGDDATRAVTPAGLAAALVANLRDAWAGMIIEWEAETIPLLDDGLPKGLELDGSIVSLATYPRLLVKYCGDASNADAPAWYKCTDTGTRDTAGAYMRLQDRRGEFARGWDHGREVDTDRVLGSWQDDDLAAHSHTLLNFKNLMVPMGSNYWVATSYTGGNDIFTNETGGLETRPRNIATMYIVLI